MIFATNNKLVDFVYLGEFSQDKAKYILQKMPPLNTFETHYSLSLYKIHYQTPAPSGKKNIASGLVAMPISPQKKVGIVSFQHGTQVTRSDAPSSMHENNYIYPALYGSSGGYMVVMPDYHGLGDSDLELHPYVQADTLASSSIDMLIAAKELAISLNYPINDTLFLAGYSEGGYSTIVMYEALLKNHKEIKVTAVAAGSAPYDWDETLRFITGDPGPRATLYLAYFFYSMQTYHHYWTGLDEIFSQPYNTLIPTLFDGYHDRLEILQSLPHDPSQIFTKSFYDSILHGTNPFYEQLKMNFNHYDFTSTSPLLLVGTKGDHNVPYHGAEIAYQVLKSRSDIVYIKHVSEVLDHIQAFPLIAKEQLEFFKKYEG